LKKREYALHFHFFFHTNFVFIPPFLFVFLCSYECRNPTFGKVWGWHSHSRNGTWESSRTPETLEFDCRGQNTSPWGVLHVIGNLLKCRCRKWPCMSHLDICSTSYGKKKGRESNYQFDSRPLKVGNWPNLGVCRWIATHRWKALNEN